MSVTRTTTIEHATIETDVPTEIGTAPSIAERWLVPVMWVAIAVVTAVTTPTAPAEVPAFQALVGEVLGWAALIAFVGMVAAATAGTTSLRLWSLGLGAVGLVGLGTCQMFGHPVLSSSWGLSQLVLVTGGLVITARLAARG